MSCLIDMCSAMRCCGQKVHDHWLREGRVQKPSLLCLCNRLARESGPDRFLATAETSDRALPEHPPTSHSPEPRALMIDRHQISAKDMTGTIQRTTQLCTCEGLCKVNGSLDDTTTVYSALPLVVKYAEEYAESKLKPTVCPGVPRRPSDVPLQIPKRTSMTRLTVPRLLDGEIRMACTHRLQSTG